MNVYYTRISETLTKFFFNDGKGSEVEFYIKRDIPAMTAEIFFHKGWCDVAGVDEFIKQLSEEAREATERSV